MDRRLRLTVLVGEALLLFTFGYFVLDLLLVRRDASVAKGNAAGLVAILVPISATAWWLFRKLRQIYSRREAGVAAITFAVFSPISLLVATPFATIPGNLAAGLLGPTFGLFGAFLGLVVLTGVLILIPMLLALWIARHVKATQRGPQ
jgi:hypothetical protein